MPRNVYEKKYSDYEFNKFGPGSKFELSHYDTVIDSNSHGYYFDVITRKYKTLFKLCKKKINQRLQDQATSSFRKLAQKTSANRGFASGKPEGSKVVRIMKDGQSMSLVKSNSNIAGFYDKPDRRHKKHFKTDVACRKTAFNHHNLDLWETGLPFIQKCSNLYRKYGRKYHDIQQLEYDRIEHDYKIPDTVFTTVTVNYNWRTSCHKDTGDYSKGLGNLIVTGQDFDGCYLGFPQFKVCIKVEPGDFLLMDVHQWHCNTEMTLLKPDGFRISYVLYLREHMSQCKKEKQIDDLKYYY